MTFWNRDDTKVMEYLKSQFSAIDARQDQLMAAVTAHKAEMREELNTLKSDLQQDLLTQYTSKLEHQTTCATMQRDNRDRYLLREDIPSLKEVVISETCDASKEKFASKESVTSLRRELYLAATAFAAAASAVTWVIDQ